MLAQQLPLSTKPLGDLRIVHLWILLCHLTSLTARPYHESIHWPFDAINVAILVASWIATRITVTPAVIVRLMLRLRLLLLLLLRLMLVMLLVGALLRRHRMHILLLRSYGCCDLHG